jgi:hypothetical protein
VTAPPRWTCASCGMRERSGTYCGAAHPSGWAWSGGSVDHGQGKRSCANPETTLRPNGLLACASSLIP